MTMPRVFIATPRLERTIFSKKQEERKCVLKKNKTILMFENNPM